MLDFEKAKEIFNSYVNEFNKEQKGILLKIEHTYKVVFFSESIARSLHLNEEEILLTKIIALLHDIGRFEQIKQIGVFDDTKIDHALLGCQILFEEKLIESFLETRKYDSLIEEAIRNHNTYKIDSQLTQKEKMFTQILRDADKLDIFRVKLEGPLDIMYSNIQNISKETISTEVFETLIDKQTIGRNQCETNLDKWLMSIGFIFDINYSYSFSYIQEKKYIDLILNMFQYEKEETNQEIQSIRSIAKDYINRKISGESYE